MQACAFIVVADHDAVAVMWVGDVAGGADGVEDHGDFFAAGGEEDVNGGDFGAEEAEFGTLAGAGGHQDQEHPECVGDCSMGLVRLSLPSYGCVKMIRGYTDRYTRLLHI